MVVLLLVLLLTGGASGFRPDVVVVPNVGRPGWSCVVRQPLRMALASCLNDLPSSTAAAHAAAGFAVGYLVPQVVLPVVQAADQLRRQSMRLRKRKGATARD